MRSHDLLHSESQGASNVQDASPEEGNETCLKDSDAPQRGNESIFGDIPTSWNQETSAEDKDSSPGDKGFIPGGKDFIPGGTDFIPGGDKLAQDDKLKESVEACSPTHTASQLIQGTVYKVYDGKGWSLLSGGLVVPRPPNTGACIRRRGHADVTMVITFMC